MMADGIRDWHPDLDEPSVLKAVDALLRRSGDNCDVWKLSPTNSP